ncbi:LamG domain-containing protein [Sorangium sp. So ce1182]|uniref:LamG domain-containing protein n=1 Tax=Sorangium sp. So ce1182 TaxID=3133334 RepID=UPI003F5ECA9B
MSCARKTAAMVLLLGLSCCGADAEIAVGRMHPAAAAGSGSGSGGGVGSGGGGSGDGGTGAAPCDELPSAAHRYTFDGEGAVVADTVGDADGEVLGGASLDGGGGLALDGEDDYVDLPAGLLAGLRDVTVMAWVARGSGGAYMRIVDLGVGSGGEDPPEGDGSVGRSYLAITPSTGFDVRGVAALASDSGAAGQVEIPTALSLDDGETHQVAVVVDGEAADMALYVDGALLGRATVGFSLAAIQDVNNWLGRSQFDQDPYFHGRYDELRIYGEALAACAVEAAWSAGPDRP